VVKYSDLYFTIREKKKQTLNTLNSLHNTKVTIMMTFVKKP